MKHSKPVLIEMVKAAQDSPICAHCGKEIVTGLTAWAIELGVHFVRGGDDEIDLHCSKDCAQSEAKLL
jgi:hypothetical protein